MRLDQLQRGLRTRVARFIAPQEAPPDAAAPYYPQQATCQIPQLHYLYSRFLGERTDGTFVEVGAYDGVFVSNTWGLAERGWRGVMAEPVPALAASCRSNHAGHPGVTVVETAVGPADQREVTLHLAGTLTTANPEAFKEYESIDWATTSLTGETVVVPCRTLDELLADQAVEPGFEVLVVDVEGFEAQVFANFDLPRWRPRMLIVELVETHPDLSATSGGGDAALGRRILEAGYVVAFKDHINTVFVHDDVWTRTFQA